ncbi:1,4-beta-xylanase [Nocardiopsis sp. MG754419]|nr:1,4-beta-xylanase [Nocardiopsis sp. MG754419]
MVVFVVAAVTTLVLPGPARIPGGTLPGLADAHGIKLGVAVAVDPLREDPAYREIVTDHYTSMTAENAMKWVHVQPERYAFDWSGPDTVVDFAEDHDLDLRGHTLLWHNQQPAWVAEGHYDADGLRAVMREHIQALLGRYEGRIDSWDVINEPFEDTGTDLRDNLWYRTLGEGYIAEGLWTAHEADPEARLYINEFGVEGGGEKADALYELASGLVADGVPLHGIGFQGHFVHGDVPDDLVENMRRFADLGLDVEISELDVRIPEPVTDEALAAQEDEYRRVVEACLDVSRCVGVSVWGVTDAHSWVPEWFPGHDAALPFDGDDRPKPALTGIHEALGRGRRSAE